jgi:hypothetical protein
MATDTVTTQSIFSFPLDGENILIDQGLIYRPWGTRTLKLEISTHKTMPKLWIHPKGIVPEEKELGIFKGYADDSDSFHITWGGGHEPGPCVKTKDRLSAFETCAPLQENESSIVFFNITHAGSNLPLEANLTLIAFESEDINGNIPKRDQAAILIKLLKPSDMPTENEVMRFKPGIEANQWIVSPGQYLPAYDSRWWPSRDVNYIHCEPIPLGIELDNGNLFVIWGDKKEIIAVIEDFSDPSVLLMAETLAFELFKFDEWSVCLRIWFFWVDKYIGGNLFLGRHEVPDAERFDMIIRRKDGRVILAGTDLHWRETWFRVLPKKTLRATIGMPKETIIKLAQQKWGEVWTNIWIKSAKQSATVDENEITNNPVDPYIKRLAAREATMTLKAKGTESHCPMLHNVVQRRPARMTSSDVRRG